MPPKKNLKIKSETYQHLVSLAHGSNPRRFIMFPKNGGDLCAHGRVGQTHIDFVPRHTLRNFVWRGSALYCASVAVKVEKRANKNVKIRLLFSETETAKQNQKFPSHFFFRFAAEGWGEEAREKCKEIFWFLHTRVRERVRGAHHWSSGFSSKCNRTLFNTHRKSSSNYLCHWTS